MVIKHELSHDVGGALRQGGGYRRQLQDQLYAGALGLARHLQDDHPGHHPGEQRQDQPAVAAPGQRHQGQGLPVRLRGPHQGHPVGLVRRHEPHLRRTCRRATGPPSASSWSAGPSGTRATRTPAAWRTMCSTWARPIAGSWPRLTGWGSWIEKNPRRLGFKTDSKCRLFRHL